MKRLSLSVLFATLVQLTFVACDNSNGGGSGGSAGSGGNANGGGGASSSSSSSSNGSSSNGSSSSGGGMLGMGECRTTADCASQNMALCFSPDAEQLCGICFNPPNPCTTDTECAMQNPTTICNKPPCSCSESECMPGCMADADCGNWEYCSPGHRCLPRMCASNTDCPANFECASMACARKTCSTDAECNGFCVNGHCYDTAGKCTLPAP